MGAATSTGVGEEVIRIVGSHLVVELMRQGLAPEAACKKAVERIISRNPAKAKTVQVGFLALNKKGAIRRVRFAERVYVCGEEREGGEDS